MRYSQRLAFRKARVAAKKSLVEAQKIERQLILKSYSEPVADPDDDGEEAEGTDNTAAPRFTRHTHHQQQQNNSSLTEEDKQTVGASSNVTNALRRTHDLIAAELARSEFAHDTLTESSAALKQLNESYGSLDSMLGQSRDLLGTLLRSQKSDTWYLQTAFYMLLTTAAWLVFRRLLYGPIWWLVLFPLRILFGVGSTASRAVLPFGKGAASSSQVGAETASQHNAADDVEGLPPADLPTAKVGVAAAEEGENAGSDAGGRINKVIDAVVGDDEGHAAHEAEEGGGIKEGIKKAAEAVVGDGEGDVEERDEL